MFYSKSVINTVFRFYAHCDLVCIIYFHQDVMNSQKRQSIRFIPLIYLQNEHNFGFIRFPSGLYKELTFNTFNHLLLAMQACGLPVFLKIRKEPLFNSTAQPMGLYVPSVCLVSPHAPPFSLCNSLAHYLSITQEFC